MDENEYHISSACSRCGKLQSKIIVWEEKDMDLYNSNLKERNCDLCGSHEYFLLYNLPERLIPYIANNTSLAYEMNRSESISSYGGEEE